jgi:hypothetical protein
MILKAKFLPEIKGKKTELLIKRGRKREAKIPPIMV